MSEPSGVRPARAPAVPLSELVRAIPDASDAALAGLDGGDPIITGITHDSRAVQAGDLYAALPGQKTHGARFARQALQHGARAVLTDPAGAELIEASTPRVVVADPRGVLGDVSAAVYGNPADAMLTFGVTGTNGKTTTCSLLDSILRVAGHQTGLIGTIDTRVGAEVMDSVRTTPEATDLHALLAVMRERGVTACSIEVSSHGLALGRVSGLVVDEAGFTQLSQDHLDFHGDMEGYYAAKRTLFTRARAADAVVCVDDSWGVRLAEEAEVPSTTLRTGESGTPAEWWVSAVEPSTSSLGSRFTLGSREHAPIELAVPMAGAFNVSNAALAAVLAIRAGLPVATIAAGLDAAQPVPGRMEPITPPTPDAPLGVVDYAHTPDAVATALATLRSHTSGRLLVVLGAGGDRDRGKRPLMGRAAAEHADAVIVTDDNPRSEDPSSIRRAVLAGAEAASSSQAEVLEVADRAEAIRAAVARASAGDVVLVAGKGHETGQTVGELVRPFDDRVELAAALQSKTGRGPGSSRSVEGSS